MNEPIWNKFLTERDKPRLRRGRLWGQNERPRTRPWRGRDATKLRQFAGSSDHDERLCTRDGSDAFVWNYRLPGSPEPIS